MTWSLLGAIWALVLASSAWADPSPRSLQMRTAADDTTGPSDETVAEQDAPVRGDEVITVTGSLVDRREVTTPSPISVLDAERLTAAGTPVFGAILQRSPAQGNAINTQNNNGGDGSIRVNLRNLGPQRTLVLVNGRRFVHGGLGADDSVDIGAIPLAMIERVEILKDGAASAYGSDAIAGVVNIITRTDFDGSEASIYTGTSQRGDGTVYNASFVTGHSSSHGNLTLAGGYEDQQAVMAGDRSFGRQAYAFDFANSVPIPIGSAATPNGRLDASLLPPGSVPGCSARYCTYDPSSGGWRDFVPPSATSLGDTYNFEPINYLSTPFRRASVFATGHQALTSDTRAFVEVLFQHRQSQQQLAEEPLSTGLAGATISSASLYNPFGVDVPSYDRRLVELGPRTYEQTVDTARLVAGVDGRIGEELGPIEDWKWELSFDYGRTDATNRTHGDVILSRLRQALGPSFVAPDGSATCGTPTAPIADCVPLDLLTPGHITQPMRDYLTFTGVNTGYNAQRTLLATAHGKLLDLPHGDISLAVGADYRREEGGYTPDPLTAAGDTTGTAQQPTSGSYEALEGFGELSAVPLVHHPWATWLELDAAVRGYRYNTFGSGGTYKLAALWRTPANVSLRATYGTAFRAPSVGELYAGHADGFARVEDPCDTTPPSAAGMTILLDPRVAAQCSAEGVPADASFGTPQQRATFGGNSELQPESAGIATAGVIYEPFAGFAASLDYWRIQLDSTIATLPPSVILTNCYYHQVDCDKIIRSATTHAISTIEDIIENVGTTRTSGVDLALSYRHRQSAGDFRHGLEASYLLAYDVDLGVVDDRGQPQIFAGKGRYDFGALPSLKLDAYSTWLHPSGFGAGIDVRVISGYRECGDNNCSDLANGHRDVSPYAAADLFAGYTVHEDANRTTHVSLGVNNVTDAGPPAIYNNPSGLNVDETTYDLIGRYFYVRIVQRL